MNQWPIIHPASPVFIPEGDTTVYAFIYTNKADATAVYGWRGKLLRYECDDERLLQAGLNPYELRASMLGHRRNSAHGIETANPIDPIVWSNGNLVAAVRHHFSNS